MRKASQAEAKADASALEQVELSLHVQKYDAEAKPVLKKSRIRARGSPQRKSKDRLICRMTPMQNHCKKKPESSEELLAQRESLSLRGLQSVCESRS